MNLIIDQGNTQTKIALFSHSEMIRWENMPEINRDLITRFTEGITIEGAIFSSVKANSEQIFSEIRQLIPNIIFLSHELPLPFTIAYQTPETLGRDRIAAIAGAWDEYPNSNILVIDAGTAITYDYIENNGNYLGGNIAPGLEMRLKALHEFTGRLPLVSKNGDAPLLGYNTETAIRSGVALGLIFEIDSYIDTLKKGKANLLVFLTGGDAFYFDKKLKNAIFADEYLVLKGLNCILKHNAKN